MHNPSDNELNKRQQQFMKLISDHKGIIYKVARMYSQNEEGRSDLMQEVVAQLWKSFDRYDESRKWSTWMYRISLNVAISYLRKETKRTQSFYPVTDQILESRYIDNEEETGEKIGLLYEFINQLNKLDKALMLLYLEDRSYQDISEILGITKTNVATKISRLKALLKHQFLQEREK